jgi:hypothetical protein
MNRGLSGHMRIRILHIPKSACIDGLRLDQFVDGHLYEVGTTVGALFLCEGWAQPVDDSSPALLIPLKEFEADAPEGPKNLVRETYPPYIDSAPSMALDRRRRPRSRYRSR